MSRDSREDVSATKEVDFNCFEFFVGRFRLDGARDDTALEHPLVRLDVLEGARLDDRLCNHLFAGEAERLDGNRDTSSRSRVPFHAA